MPGRSDGERAESQMRMSALRWLELALLVPAFGFVIPPVSSTPDPPRLFPGVLFAGALLLGSLAISVHRRADSWPTAAVKLALFIAFAWVVHLRLRMPP